MRLADFSLTPTLKDFVDLRAGIVRDYCALMRRTSRGVCVQVIDALKRDDKYDPARQSRAVHLKTNFQLDKQAVRY
jgi:hypothetical protein